MALSTYDELKAAVSDWMHRSDVTGNVVDWVTLAEAHLNRELNPVEEEATLTGTVDSRTIDVSSLSIVEPMELYLTETSSGDEIRLTKKNTFAYDSTSDEPELWSYDSDDDEINFNRPCDQSYSFRFQYRERFTLSDSATTNWLLTNHPDVYLAACIMWGGMYTEDDDRVAKYASILQAGLPSVRNIIAQQHRAMATVDPGLTSIGGNNRYYDYDNDS